MKALVCEMCGSRELIKQDGYYVCQSCGTKYSLEEAKKLLVEVKGSVSIDKSKELNNLYSLARRARNESNSENAEKYYSQILAEDPDSWEANFYSTYYRSMNCKIGQISSAALNVITNLESTFSLIEKIDDENERKTAFEQVTADLIRISRMLFNGAKNHFDGIDSDIKSKYKGEFMDRCINSAFILDEWGSKLEKYDSNIEIRKCIIDSYKAQINLYSTLCNSSYVYYGVNVDGFNNILSKQVAYIKKYEQNYESPITQKAAEAKSENAKSSILVWVFVFIIIIVVTMAAYS